MSKRQSRRTRGERPELVPPKSDEEPDLDDGNVDEKGNNIAMGAIRGRRRGKRGRTSNKDADSTSSFSQPETTTTTAENNNNTKKQQGRTKSSSKSSSKPQAVVAKKRGRPRGRPPMKRNPSQSSLSMSLSASPSTDEEEDDDTTDNYESNPFDSEDSDDSKNGGDDDDDDDGDDERDTEDDAPKEALTGKKNSTKKSKKKQQNQQVQEGSAVAAAGHPRYKNPIKMECRHCGKLCFSQGIKIHEMHCMPVYTPRAVDSKKTTEGKTTKAKKQQRRKKYERRGSGSSGNSRRSSGSSNSSSSDSSDTSSPPSPVVIVRKKPASTTPKKSAVAQQREKGSVPSPVIIVRKKAASTNPKKSAPVHPREKGSVSTDPTPKSFVCRNCGKFFTPRGINAHEKRCMTVYAERSSMSPDIKPKKEKETETEESDSESKDQEHETSNSSGEADTSDIEEETPIVPTKPKSSFRICTYCGKEVNSRGFKQHERSCAKKERAKTMARNKKTTALKDKGETTKKRKRKMTSDKGAAATTDEDGLWEDDASSSAAKPKGKSTTSNDANTTTTDAGEGKSAEGNPPKNSSNDPQPELSLSVSSPKRKKRNKNTKEDDEGSGREKIVVDDSSSSSVGENNPPKKKKTTTKTSRKHKSKIAERLANDVGAVVFSQEDLLPIASTLASLTKLTKKPTVASGKARPTTSKKGNAVDGKDKTSLNNNYTAHKNKVLAKNSKLSKAMAKGKNTPITQFFSKKNSSEEQQTKTPAASREDGKGKKSIQGRNTGNDPTIVEKEPASTSTKKQKTVTEETTPSTGKKTNKEKEGSNSKIIGEDEGLKSAKDDQNSGSKTATAPKTKKYGIVNVVDGEKKVKSTSSKAKSNRVKPTAILDTVMGEALDDSSAIDKGMTASRKPLEKKEKNKSTKSSIPSTRPSRKRKLTPKAAQAAAIVAFKIEEKRIEISESDVVVVDESSGSSGLDLGKKPKTKHGDGDDVGQPVLPSNTRPPLEPQTTNPSLFVPETKCAAATALPKDQKAKASIVEAAKNAAAATLAAFSMFATTARPVKAEARRKSAELPPSAVLVEKPKTDVAIPSNSLSKEQSQDGEESQKEGNEIPLDDTKIAKPTEAVPVSIDARSSKQNHVTVPSSTVGPQDVDKGLEEGKETRQGDTKTTKPTEIVSATTVPATKGKTSSKQNNATGSAIELTPEVLNSDSGQTTLSSTITIAASGEPPPSLNAGEEVPTAVPTVAPSEGGTVTNPTDQTTATAKTEDESVGNSRMEPNPKENKSSTLMEKINVPTVETGTTNKDSSSLAKDEASKSDSNQVTAESVGDVNNDASPMNKIDGISVRQNNSPITSDKANEELQTTDDPEELHSSEQDASNGDENRVETKESMSVTEELTTSTNGILDRTKIDQGTEKHGMDPEKADPVEKSANETGIVTIGFGESEEKDSIQSPQRTILETKTPLAVSDVKPNESMEQPRPESPIEVKDDIDAKDNIEEVQEPKVLETLDAALHVENDEVREETSVAVKEKEPIVEVDEENESDEVEVTDQTTLSKEEIVGGISSDVLGDDLQNAEDDSKKIDNDDNEHPADDSAEVEVIIEGDIVEPMQNMAEIAEGQNGKESSKKLQDATKKPEVVEENSSQSNFPVPSSTDLKESISDSMESEKHSNVGTPENATRISEDGVAAGCSPAKTKGVEEEPSPSADKANHLPDSSSTSTATLDITVNKTLETKSIEQSTESGEDDFMETTQLSDVSKRESLNDEIEDVKTLHVETPSQVEEPLEFTEGAKEDTDTSRTETAAIPQLLENSIDWKETVSIQTKADNGSKDEASNMSEGRSTATPVNEEKTIDNSEVATDEHEDKTSKATCKDTQDTKSNVMNDVVTQEMVTNEEDINVQESDTIAADAEIIENVAQETKEAETRNVATGSNVENPEKSDLSDTIEKEVHEDEENPSADISNEVKNPGHDVSSEEVTGEEHIPPGETDSKSIENNSDTLNSLQPDTSLIARNELHQPDSRGQGSASNEADSKSEVKIVDDESNEDGENRNVDITAENESSEMQSKSANNIEEDANDDSRAENISSETQLKSIEDNDESECDKNEEAKSSEQIKDVSSGLSHPESKSFLETSANDSVDLEAEKQSEALDALTKGDEGHDSKELVTTGASNVTETEESKSNINLSQLDEMKVPTQSMVLPSADSKIDLTDATRNVVSAMIESLLSSVESRVNMSLMDVTDMEIDTSPGSTTEVDLADNSRMEVDGPDNISDSKDESSVSCNRKSHEIKSNDTDDIKTPPVAISVDGVNAEPDTPDSAMDVEVLTEASVEAEEPKEEMKISWVAISKASRKSKPLKDTSRFVGYDENTTNRVKMLLYTTGSKTHRGRGFERIFGMYWDAICHRLSRPLNENVSKRCDQAISVFLKSRKLRKIHNKFVMSIMRRALKNRVPYSEVAEHVPIKWQDRVKVPIIISSRKTPKKKNDNLYEWLENDFLNILSSVPHLDKTTPYKERWEFLNDEKNEIQQNPQEGPTIPIASSCIPGALVVDPMLRETVEASDMKVTDNAMWLLTVALKEHIKNILNDSIDYKKGLKKGEIFPQAIHYPNVLASTTSKNRKISKGRSSAVSLENGRKKRINSLDLFAALNMLPSGQPSSIGGSVSRISLEHTFLSGFNSIPSFDTGNAFKDVHSFISNTMTEMTKNRKPEDKMVKASNKKSTEKAKPVSREEDSAKTPLSRHSSLSSSVKASESIAAAPMASLESPPLKQVLSPAIVKTPVLDSSSPKVEVSQLVSNKQNDAVTSKAPSASVSQGADSNTPRVNEMEATKVEKAVQKVTTDIPTSQSGPQRSGAGRGAKNLAALMARAATETSSSKSNESAQGGEKSNRMNNDPSSSATVKAEPNKATAEKPIQQHLQSNVGQPKLTADPFQNGELSKPADNTNAQTSECAAGSNERLPTPPQQPTDPPAVPVRRGKGKGFGSKNLAAMRARSLTTSTTETEEANDSKPADK